MVGHSIAHESRMRSLAVVILVAIVTWPMTARSEDPEANLLLPGGARLIGSEPDLASVGAGLFDVLQEGLSTQGTAGHSAAGSIEYRSGHKLLFFGPLLGVLGNSKGGVLGYGGVFVDIGLGSWRLTPTVAAGGYRRGKGKELGGVFEFHSGANLAYELRPGLRFGLEVDHISNGNIHYRNPGAEVALVTLMFAVP
jgi:lipid A 3-O-deacylase